MDINDSMDPKRMDDFPKGDFPPFHSCQRVKKWRIMYDINGHATGTDLLEAPTIYVWPMF